MVKDVLLGPIPNGASFMLTSIQNGVPFVLNSAPFGSGVIYYWESDFDTLTNNPNLPVFSAQGTASNAVIADTANGGGIGFRIDGVTIGNAATPATLNMSQPLFATWWPNDTFLSGVEYTIYNANGATAGILTNSAGTGASMPANNVMILSTLWYFNCTSSGQTENISVPVDSVVNWICLITPDNPGCQDVETSPPGWTNITDCINGVDYSYCAIATNCGASNCNGPCQQSYYNCDYNSSSSTFGCSFDPSKYFSTTKWYETPWFIGLVVGIVLVIIVIVALMFVFLRRGKKTPQSK